VPRFPFANTKKIRIGIIITVAIQQVIAITLPFDLDRLVYEGLYDGVFGDVYGEVYGGGRCDDGCNGCDTDCEDCCNALPHFAQKRDCSDN
jgi:hypothetical protein